MEKEVDSVGERSGKGDINFYSFAGWFERLIGVTVAFVQMLFLCLF